SADRLSKASQELLASYGKLGGGLTQLSKAYADTQAGQAALAAGLVEVESGLGGLGQTYPELQKDPDYIRLQDSVSGMKTNAAELSAGLKQLNGQLAGISGGLEQANAGLSRAAAGQAALTKGLASLSQGLAELQDGLGQAAGGQSRIMAGLPALSGGIDGLAAGQRKLQSGLAQLNDQLGELASGLDQSVSGLGQVTDGLQSAQSYLDELAGSPDKQLTGWFIPAEAIARSGFQAALDVYLSEDRRIAKFDVVFEGNPYELNTMAKIDDLKAAADRALQGTPAGGGAEVAVGGVTSVNEDLRSISAADYSRTVVLMLIGITLILILLFRSVVIPIYLVLSLLLTYYTSVAIAEVIFVRVVGLSGISWAVPFFGFVMLMALGIDYSIFLMDRFKEYRHLKPAEAILLAMRKMGSVIMSAALILGGTFAAMLPSGVMSLLQIATIVLCGLFLYALVVLPLFIPVMVRSFGEANWWPFMKREGVGGTELRGKESLTG
ncbi:membrane protein, partial [Paenibacillus darwinianus]